VFHQLGDFSVMLHRKHSLEYTLLSQIVTGTFALLGGYIALNIDQAYDVYLNLFVVVSFCYVIFTQILPELIGTKSGFLMMVAECVMIATGFLILH